MFRFIPARPALVALLIAMSLAGSLLASDFPAQMNAGKHRLMLNGSGPRTKFFLELYVAGLYLADSDSNAEEIAAANEPMSIRVKITSRMVTQAKLSESMNDGFQTVTGGNQGSIQRQIDQFKGFLAEEVKSGDVFDFVYVPEHGVVINKNGKFKGVVAGLPFKKALFSIWLSNNPVDANLRQAMLKGRTRR